MKTQLTVLVAEDDANDVFLLRRAFMSAELNLNLAHVPNGREAVDYLRGVRPYCDRAVYPLPELLLTDLNMPLMNGLELLSWLRNQLQLSWLPAVVLSSSGLGTDRAKALQLGASAYYTKPPRFSELVGVAREIHHGFLNPNRAGG